MKKAEIKLLEQYRGSSYVPQRNKRETVIVNYNGYPIGLLHSKIGNIDGGAIQPYVFIYEEEKTKFFKIWILSAIEFLSNKKKEGYMYCVAICDSEDEVNAEFRRVQNAIYAASCGANVVIFTALERKKTHLEQREKEYTEECNKQSLSA